MLDLTKPVQTRDGKPARVICTDFKTPYSDSTLVALILYPDGYEELVTFFHDGTHARNQGLSLVNVPEKRYVAITTNGYTTHGYSDKSTALEIARESGYQALELTIENGKIIGTKLCS